MAETNKSEKPSSSSELKSFPDIINGPVLIGCMVAVAIVFTSIMFVYAGTILYRYLVHAQISNLSNAWGNFGALIGGILGPSLSLIAILVVLYTLREQRKATELQSTENIFFQLFNAHIEKVNNIKITYEGKEYFGSNAFDAMNSLFNDLINKHVIPECKDKIFSNFNEVRDKYITPVTIQLRDGKYAGSEPLESLQKKYLKFCENSNAFNATRQILAEASKSIRSQLIHDGYCNANIDTLNKLSALWFSSLSENDKLDLFGKIYDDFYDQVGSEIGHYFRNMYCILMVITDSHVNDPEKYIRIFRSQLSHFELPILLYNCLFGYSSCAFNGLVRQYKLLKGISCHDLPTSIDENNIRDFWMIRQKRPFKHDYVLSGLPVE